MSEVTGCGILDVLLAKNVKEIFWDLKFLSEVTGCQKTQVSEHTGSTVSFRWACYSRTKLTNLRLDTHTMMASFDTNHFMTYV